MTKNQQKGFTLVELMIVVAIIGILAAVAIPKFAQMLEKSREGATKGNLSAIKSAVSNYYADQQGNYPFTPLDSNSFYMPVTGASFPAFIPQYLDDVPPVKVTGMNTGNAPDNNFGPGVGISAAGVYLATYSSPTAFTNLSTGQGWRYDNISGAVWVNSDMMDMNFNSYTLFGYN